MPSSLTMLLPSALGFSPHPPVSVYGTGAIQTIAAFLDAWLTLFPTLNSVRITSSDCRTDLPVRLLPRLRRAFHSRLVLSTRVPHSSVISRYRNFNLLSIGYVFRPGLRPRLTRADQLYSGNLRYSAGRILTFLSLLIPAFSLLYSPQLLIGTASSRIQCSSTNVQVHS